MTYNSSARLGSLPIVMIEVSGIAEEVRMVAFRTDYVDKSPLG